MFTSLSRKEIVNVYSGGSQYPPALFRVCTENQEPTKTILDWWSKYKAVSPLPSVKEFCKQYGLKFEV